MKNLSIDIETYSSADLSKCGVYRYAEALDFEVLLFGYSVDSGPVQVVDLANGESIPKAVADALEDEAVTKWAFNAQFERVCLSRYLNRNAGDYLDPESWRCTMVWSAYMGLPLSLEGAGAVLGLEKQKLTEGKELIRYFCQPCKPTAVNCGRTRNLPIHAPEKWDAFKAYNLRDVETELSIQHRLLKYPVPETVWDEYHLDQEINDRGVALDMTLVREAISILMFFGGLGDKVENDKIPENLDNVEFMDWKRKTTVFLASQGISLFGSSMVNFAIVWYVTLETSSGIMMAISILTSFLPQVVISLFAGVWADRYNRKHVIMLSDALTAFSTLILAILFLTGYREIWLIFAGSAIRSIGAGIQSPAVSAILPQFVPSNKLMKVNGINGSLRSFITLLSPAAGGWILGAYSVEIAFFVDVVTAAVAITILLFLQVHTHNKAKDNKHTSVFEDLKQGITYVKGNTLIRNLVIYYAFFFFLISPAAFLTPLLISRSYGEEVWRLTANEILYSGGAVVGGFIMAFWGGFKNRMVTIALSCAAYGVSAVLLGVSTNFIFYLTIMFFTGIFAPIFSASETVLIQETVNNDMQGRVFGIIDMIIMTVMPIGMLIFGPIADLTKVEYIMVATGFLMIVTGWAIFADKVNQNNGRNKVDL